MRRVGSKMTADKMSHRAKKTSAADRGRRRIFMRRDRGMKGNRRNSRYPSAFAANLSAGSSNASLGIDLKTDAGRSASMKRRPDSGDSKGEVARGATMRRKGVGNCRSEKAAAAMCAITIFCCLQLLVFLYSIHGLNCRHKRQAIALYRCPAIHSALACGPGDHGEWSVPVGSDWCHK